MTAKAPREVFKSAVVLGTGLMGTSMALALSKFGVAGVVTGYDPSPEARAMASERKCYASIEGDLEKALVGGSSGKAPQLVIVAAPPRAVRELLPAIARMGGPGRFVMDLASTKRAIVEVAEAVFPNTAVAFVGGHPMAGAPSGAARAARADLFADAPFALCPMRATPQGALDKAKVLVSMLGARPIVVDAAAHDKAVARISHLPHLAAVATAIAAGEAPDEKLAAHLAASGFRSTTRVAAGGRPLWTEVLLDNRDEALACVDALKAAVASIEDALRTSDEEALGGVLEFAREIRAKLLEDKGPSGVAKLEPDEDSGERP